MLYKTPRQRIYMNPTFSIIVPTFNRGYILWEIIQSIQKQTWPYWELLIIDDGSIDDTKKVIREFQKDPRIHYFYKKNGGSASARNLGLKKASSEFVTYVDSDDIIFPHYLLLAKEHFEQHPEKTFALVNGNFKIEIYDDEGFIKKSERIGLCYPKEPSIKNFYDWDMLILGGTGLFHKRSMLDNKTQWRSVSPVEDLEFLMQLGMLNPQGFMYIPHVCYEYKQRYGKDGIYANAQTNQWKDSIKKIYELHQHDPLMTHQELYLEKFAQYQQRFHNMKPVNP